jgi:hypothetical protein
LLGLFFFFSWVGGGERSAMKSEGENSMTSKAVAPQ